MTQHKDIYELGEFPPLGFVPPRMYAAVIRRERFGSPINAFRIEEVVVPQIGPKQVLVWVMAAGVNYNNVWASLGHPVDVISQRQRQGDKEDFHIGGSDASGIVWAVGRDVENVTVGDEVVVSCGMWDEDADDIKGGADPITSTSARIWGYEENWGSFAQFACVDNYQCHMKPARLSWAAAAAYMLVGATAWRMLHGWPPHTVQRGDPVLVWGGAGGLGSMAIQLVREAGGVPVAVISDESKIQFCLDLGAKGVINRSEFRHWGRLPNVSDTDAYRNWIYGASEFRRKFSDVLGYRCAPRIVIEHPGEATIPTSLFICDNAGMVVCCAGTSGYNADVDLRYLWMRQKRFQGSHFANVEQCRRLNDLVATGRIDPLLSRIFCFREIGKAHQLMYENCHEPGNMAIVVNAPA